MIASIQSYDRPADRIRQHRQADDRPIILLEGPSDEDLFWTSFKAKYITFVLNSRSNVLDIGERLASWKVERVVCVVDRDFDDEVARREQAGSVPVLAYENADLEAMITHSEALYVMLRHIGSNTKLESYGYQKLVQDMHRIVLPIARLRAMNARRSWGLAFDKVDLRKRIDVKTLEFDLNGYCFALKQTSDRSPDVKTLIAWADGTKLISDPPSCPRGSHPYFRGRDLLLVAGVALRAIIGSCKLEQTSIDHLERVARAVYSRYFPNTQWATDLGSMLDYRGVRSIPTQVQRADMTVPD